MLLPMPAARERESVPLEEEIFAGLASKPEEEEEKEEEGYS